jgi:hypothetical protein
MPALFHARKAAGSASRSKVRWSTRSVVPKQQPGVDAQHLGRFPQHVGRLRAWQRHRNVRLGRQIGERSDGREVRGAAQ